MTYRRTFLFKFKCLWKSSWFTCRALHMTEKQAPTSEMLQLFNVMEKEGKEKSCNGHISKKK